MTRKRARPFYTASIARRIFEYCFQLANIMRVTSLSLNQSYIPVEMTHEILDTNKPGKIEIGLEKEGPTAIQQDQTLT